MILLTEFVRKKRKDRDMKPKKTISKWVYYFTLIVASILVYKFVNDFGALCELLGRIISVIMPFIIGIIVAYLFYRPVSFLEKLLNKNKLLAKFSRPASVFAVYLVAIALIVLLINVVVPPIKESTEDLFKNLPTYVDMAKEHINKSPDDSILKQINIEEIEKRVTEFDLASLLSTEKLLEYANKVIGVFGVVFNIFVTIIISIYILLQRKDIKDFLKKLGKSLFETPNYKRVSKYFKESNRIFLNFIYCQIIDGIIIGILASIAMSIIGVKYAILLGFCIGLFNIIPYFGAIIAIAAAVLVTLFTGGIQQAAIMAITVIILQQIDANIINPKILGDGLKISPILVIFAVTIGGEFFHVMGMFLAVPIVAIIKLLVMDFIEIRGKLKVYRKKYENSVKRDAEI